MKFNIEVEIDWLNEEEGLDETVKQSIIDGIIAQLSSGYISKIKEEAEKRFASQVNGNVNNKLDELITGLFDSFMNKGITPVDQWGDPTGDPIQIIDMLKKKLENALDERVNNNGNPSQYGDKSRLDYMLNSRIKEAVETMTKSVISGVDAKISQQLNEEVRKRLSGSLLEKIDVDGIIGNVVKGLKS